MDDERSGASTNTGNSKLALIIFLFRGIRRKSRDALTRIALWLLR